MGGEQAGWLKNLRPKPSEPQETIWIPAPAIIDEATWDRANEILRHSAQAQRKRLSIGDQNEHFYPLAGFLKHEDDARLDNMTGVVPRGKSQLVRNYACSTSTSKWKGRHPNEEPCNGFGITQNQHRAKRVRASLVESIFIMEMVNAFSDEETLAEFIAESDHRAVAADRSSETLAEARAALLAHDAEQERAMLLFQKGLSTEAQLDSNIAGIQAARTEQAERVARLQADAVEAEAYAATVADMLEMTLRILNLMPGDEGTYIETEPQIVVDEGYDIKLPDGRVVHQEGTGKVSYDPGGTVVETWGWTEVLNWLRAEATACLRDRDRELDLAAREWIEKMVHSFAVIGTITEDGEYTEPEAGVTSQKDPLVSFSGRIKLGQDLPVSPVNAADCPLRASVPRIRTT